MKTLPGIPLIVLLVFGATLLQTPTALADDYTLVVFKSTNGTRYALSTLTTTGSCVDIPDGKKCTDAGRETSVTNAGGCGPVSGGAMCVVVPETWKPVFMMDVSTLECASGKRYQVSDGRTGACTPNDRKQMTCSQSGTKNAASATCAAGCGVATGAGSCVPQ